MLLDFLLPAEINSHQHISERDPALSKKESFGREVKLQAHLPSQVALESTMAIYCTLCNFVSGMQN